MTAQQPAADAAAPLEDAGPWLVAGLPAEHWLFALRIWAAMVVALGVAFWLQLDSADTAAVTVGILAQPQRGQAFRKAVYFFAATLLGIAASFAITGAFAQLREPFIVAVAAWLAATVYIAAFLDGARSYGAVLSGYTVAIVAVTQIDAPQDVFSSGTNRLAAISVGIASVVFINDVLGAPTVLPAVREGLNKAERVVWTLVTSLAGGDPVPPETLVRLLGSITGTRLAIQAIASEGPEGRDRAAAAASAATALVAALLKARGLFAIARDGGDPEADEARGLVAAGDEAAALSALGRRALESGRTSQRVARLAVAADLLGQMSLARRELAALDASRPASRRVTMPIHRDSEVARLAAIRVFAAVTGAAWLLTLSSWPSTSSALLFTAVLGALSSTMPDPRAFARTVVIGVPCAAVSAGVTKFLILDGSDAFPMLAIGMAPPIFLSCLLSRQKRTAGVGGLMTTFTVVLLSPSNPQSYNPQDYLQSVTMLVTGSYLFAAILFAFSPVKEKDRRRWMMRRAWTDLLGAAAGRPPHAPADATFLSATRLVALAASAFPGSRQRDLDNLLLISTLTVLVGEGQQRLDRLSRQAAAAGFELQSRAALAQLDPELLQEAADTLLAALPDAPSGEARGLARLLADLALSARLAEARAPVLRRLRRLFA